MYKHVLYSAAEPPGALEVLRWWWCWWWYWY